MARFAQTVVMKAIDCKGRRWSEISAPDADALFQKC